MEKVVSFLVTYQRWFKLLSSSLEKALSPSVRSKRKNEGKQVSISTFSSCFSITKEAKKTPEMGENYTKDIPSRRKVTASQRELIYLFNQLAGVPSPDTDSEFEWPWGWGAHWANNKGDNDDDTLSVYTSMFYALKGTDSCSAGTLSPTPAFVSSQGPVWAPSRRANRNLWWLREMEDNTFLIHKNS